MNPTPPQQRQGLPQGEANVDVTFPVLGVDVAHGIDVQPPQTTILGVNVRAFEPSTNRARGGTRPMLVKFLAEQIPEGAVLIQHLNYVVDPAGTATFDLVDYQLGFIGVDFIKDPSFPDELGNRGGWLDETGADDDTGGRFVRVGGDGRTKRRRSTKTPLIQWANPTDVTVGTTLDAVQLNAVAINPTTGSTVTGTFTYTPPSGTLLDVIVNSLPLSVTFLPDSTNVWSPAARTVYLNVVPLSLTITASDQTKDPGDVFSFASTEFTTSGLQGTDTVTSASLFSSGAQADAAEGTYPITISGAVGTGLARYTITYVPGIMTVGQGPPTFVRGAAHDVSAPLDSASLDLGTVQSGDLLLVAFWESDDNYSPSGDPSVSGGPGVSWSQVVYNPVIVDAPNGGRVKFRVWAGVCTSSGNATITVTPGTYSIPLFANGLQQIIAVCYRGAQSSPARTAMGQFGTAHVEIDDPFQYTVGPVARGPSEIAIFFDFDGLLAFAQTPSGTAIHTPDSEIQVTSADTVTGAGGEAQVVLDLTGLHGISMIIWAAVVYGKSS